MFISNQIKNNKNSFSIHYSGARRCFTKRQRQLEQLMEDVHISQKYRRSFALAKLTFFIQKLLGLRTWRRENRRHHDFPCRPLPRSWRGRPGWYCSPGGTRTWYYWCLGGSWQCVRTGTSWFLAGPGISFCLNKASGSLSPTSPPQPVFFQGILIGWRRLRPFCSRKPWASCSGRTDSYRPPFSAYSDSSPSGGSSGNRSRCRCSRRKCTPSSKATLPPACLPACLLACNKVEVTHGRLTLSHLVEAYLGLAADLSKLVRACLLSLSPSNSTSTAHPQRLNTAASWGPEYTSLR